MKKEQTSNLIMTLIIISFWVAGCSVSETAEVITTQSVQATVTIESAKLHAQQVPESSSLDSELYEELKGLPIDQFFEQSFNRMLIRSPELLTGIGIAEMFGMRNDQLDNLSADFIRETQMIEEVVLEVLKTYNRTSLTPEQQISYDVCEWYLDIKVGGHEFMYHHYPVHHFIHSYYLNVDSLFTTKHPFRNKQDVDDYISRLSQVKTQVEQLMDRMITSEELGVIPPRFIVELTKNALLEYLGLETSELSAINPKALSVYTNLSDSLNGMDSLTSVEVETFLDVGLTQIKESFIPAFISLILYQDHLMTISNDEAGAWKLPSGNEYYAYMLRRESSTDLTPEEVHQIGLAEVDRIQKEMHNALVALGYPQEDSLSMLMARMIADAGSYDISTQEGRDQIVSDSKAYVKEIEGRIGEFSSLRRYVDLEVIGANVPQFFYQPGSAPAGRAGIYYVAWLGDSFAKYTVQSTAYHEAIPGHFFQDSVSQGGRLPLFRYLVFSVAYDEGWGLYAERLAWEMGMFENNPYGNIGRLQMELLRAVRLVTDTGIHAKGWSREKAQDYMDESTGTPGDFIDEVDRYVVIPGQATGYKIGMMKILELRQLAMDQLGDQFDIIMFHDVVLGNGSLPLEVLERLVIDYINSE